MTRISRSSRSWTASIAAVTALAIVPAVSAHITVAPPYVADGAITVMRFTMPNERPRRATVGLSVTAPAGVAVVSAESPTGWHETIRGQTVRWTGGRIAQSATAVFPISVRPSVHAGTYAFTALQRYDDGDLVRWQVLFTALPATGRATPKQHAGRGLIAAAVGLLAIIGVVGGVRTLSQKRP